MHIKKQWKDMMDKPSNTMKQDQSRIDPRRQTVGKIYRDAALKNTDAFVESGDLARELTKSLVEDLNEAIASNPFEGKTFYITIYEKKDLQMKRAILRRPYKTLYRPYPEDDTLVFHVDPRTNKVKFCWCLPHHTEMGNVILNFLDYPADYVQDIQAYQKMDLKYFGFDSIRTTFKGKKVTVLSESKENRDRLINAPEISFSF